MRGKFSEVIGCDIDPAVYENKAVDRSIQMVDGKIPLSDSCVDVIVADFVLEHVVSVDDFVTEVRRILKPGGWFCARTPHKFHYVALAVRVIPLAFERAVLHRIQPERKYKDVFPAVYKLNTLRDITSSFSGWGNQSYFGRTGPAYYFGSRFVYNIADFFHRVFPAFFSGSLFVFLQKPCSAKY